MISHEDDRRVLCAMASNGCDLAKPAHTIHYLYFKTLSAAKTAGSELEAAGYHNIEVKRAPAKSVWNQWFGPREYSCIVETHAVPSEENVFAATDLMNTLAQRLGGEYDGWEASVEK